MAHAQASPLRVDANPLAGGNTSGPARPAPRRSSTEAAAGFLRIEGLSKAFVPTKPVFADVSFTIDRGEFVCIIGHSGCGKTTILNVLAGLDTASGGHVFMDGREIAGPSLSRGVVFQSHALMPWLTVRKNIAFAVESRWPEWTAAQVNEHVKRFVALVGLAAAIDKKPSQLSGGMKQRVGIARAFAIEPKMLLLDEPFGALDALTRGTIQDELMRIVRQTQQTVFMITHDVDEAILLADRILLMSNGNETTGGYRAGNIAETVVNPLPRERTRAGLHHLEGYYALRNHIVDFLVSRANCEPPRAPAARGSRPPEGAPVALGRPGGDNCEPPRAPAARGSLPPEGAPVALGRPGGD